MTSLEIPLFYSSELSGFDFGPGHPFTGERFESFIELLDRVGIKERCRLIEPVPATDEELRLVHTQDYLAHVGYLERTRGRLTMDTPVSTDVVSAQRLITGSGLRAADLILDGEENVVHTFGGLHHAGRDYGEGFCVFNDVAIVAQHLLDARGLKRVMVVDTDAHQGNGTMDVFYADPRVLFVSTHQDPRTLYPGKGFVWETGSGEGKGFTVNLPMPPYAGYAQYEHVFDEVIMPLAKEFRPQMVIRNGGSDPHYADELTMLGLDLDGLCLLGSRTRDISDNTCGRLLDMMLSGYGESVIYGWLALFCGVEKLDVDYAAHSPPEPDPFVQPSDSNLTRFTEAMVEELISGLREHWSCF
ncbi:MAG: acetoin utilization protein AcuC [Thermoplasmata archaeon]|nr:acetoin utilization protein AcuC [Thermoplasmata archaeon]